ncbi:MAG TPA: ATP synthase F1 subunit delta, partial [Bryobacteraceae bacterium]|nr:ATP synthase F1 subunit delta [Bryobacteraceae bacterium]
AVASRYARALADLVLDRKTSLEPEQAVRQLTDLSELITGSPELRTVLVSPAVKPARKRALLARLSEALGVASIIRNFLYVVVDHRRTPLLPEIKEAFREIIDERTGYVQAQVFSARSLSETERERVIGRLALLTGKQVRCNFGIKPELIGGLVARIGSTIYDGSVQGQLEALRRRLME